MAKALPRLRWLKLNNPCELTESVLAAFSLYCPQLSNLSLHAPLSLIGLSKMEQSIVLRELAKLDVWTFQIDVEQRGSETNLTFGLTATQISGILLAKMPKLADVLASGSSHPDIWFEALRRLPSRKFGFKKDSRLIDGIKAGCFKSARLARARAETMNQTPEQERAGCATQVNA